MATCLLVPLVAGCVTGPEPDRTAENIRDVASEWKWALAREDFDAAMALIADDFSSERWPARGDLAYYLQQAEERDYFAEAIVSDESPDVTFQGEEAIVYPVGLRARLGTAVFKLTLKQTESDWRIVSARLELY